MAERDMSVYRTPEFRVLVSKNSKRMWKGNAELRLAAGKMMSERWKNADFRDSMIRVIKERWSDPTFKECMRLKHSDIWTPARRKSMSRIMKSKMSDSVFHKKVSDGVRRAIAEGRLNKFDNFRGRVHTVETKRKMSLARSRWHRQNVGAASVFNTGRRLSLVSRNRIAMTLRDGGYFAGSGNPNWHGGVNVQQYPSEFNRTLKFLVREFYGSRCAVCGGKDLSMLLDVHHVDYNKKNCSVENLIPLCRPCHMKTSYNRGVWLSHFKSVVKSCLADESFSRFLEGGGACGDGHSWS